MVKSNKLIPLEQETTKMKSAIIHFLRPEEGGRRMLPTSTEYYATTVINSRPLKTIFQHKVCIDKLYADSFYKVQKNSHSSFEVICCRS